MYRGEVKTVNGSVDARSTENRLGRVNVINANGGAFLVKLDASAVGLVDHCGKPAVYHIGENMWSTVGSRYVCCAGLPKIGLLERLCAQLFATTLDACNRAGRLSVYLLQVNSGPDSLLRLILPRSLQRRRLKGSGRTRLRGNR